MAVLTPGTTTGWNLQKWQRTVENATYEKMKFVKVIDEGDRPFGTLNIRKHARVTATVLAQSAEGDSLTPSTIIGTPITVVPAGHYVAVAWSENEAAQLDINLDAEGRSNIEGALAESTDTDALALAITLTQAITQADVDAPMWYRAHGTLMGNTNGMVTAGQSPQVHAFFSHTQLPNLGTIPAFNQADVRGGSETPYVDGIFVKGGGVKLHLSTVVAEDGGAWHNVMFHPSAFVTAWNDRTTLKRQDEWLQNRLVIFNNVGHAVKHDLRAVAMRTTNNPL